MTEIIRKSPRFALVMSAVMIAAFALAGWSFIQGRRDVCHGRAVSLNVLHDIVQLAQPTKAELGRMPPDRRVRSQRFFDHAYARIQQARC